MTITIAVNGVSAVADVTSKTNTFDFTLEDPCNPPDSLVPDGTQADIDYTITTAALKITPPGFTITPSFCKF